ncbi:MAG: 3-oxoacyl-[acyl-carrier protein] reductase [Gammaproteobacteria bacterium]|jgi:3-oxoacyl-[acyl-carrier protein] reductase
MAARIAAETGAEIIAIAPDMRSLQGCENFVSEAAERFGDIEILVNNAGASAFGAFVDLPAGRVARAGARRRASQQHCSWLVGRSLQSHGSRLVRCRHRYA